jgi:L-methionine (R)-S-oxide reductase
MPPSCWISLVLQILGAGYLRLKLGWEMSQMSHPMISDTYADWLEVLEQAIVNFSCASGTIHLLNKETGLLELAAQKGIPPFLMDKIQHIPLGKGIAGCAAQRMEPVQLCNLQEDGGGVARPDAVATKVSGALAVPMRDASGTLRGVIGIGKMEAYEFTEAEVQRFQAHADQLTAALP